ncbi:MAG: hypothetical protein E6417_38780, partial [Bradyrhizobium sp.]|nr:hypothetical protein [Bradyrhizobium sp.]
MISHPTLFPFTNRLVGFIDGSCCATQHPEHPREMMMMTVRVRASGAAALAVAGLCAGCNTVTPVAYSEVASARYLAPNAADASGRMPYRY